MSSWYIHQGLVMVRCHTPTTKALSVERGSEHDLPVIRWVGVVGRGDAYLGVRNT